jgi:hypothetical protein
LDGDLGLIAIKHWTAPEVALQFASAVVQYFICSTFSIMARDGAAIDLPALFEKRRPVIFGAFVVMAFVAMFQNFWDRNNTAGLSPTAWIDEDLSILPVLAAALIAGWAQPRWLQWTAGIATLALSRIFFVGLRHAGVRGVEGECS